MRPAPTYPKAEINQNRRRLLGAAAFTFTATELCIIGTAHAETNPAPLPVIEPETNTSFARPKQIDAGVLKRP